MKWYGDLEMPRDIAEKCKMLLGLGDMPALLKLKDFCEYAAKSYDIHDKDADATDLYVLSRLVRAAIPLNHIIADIESGLFEYDSDLGQAYRTLMALIHECVDFYINQ